MIRWACSCHRGGGNRAGAALAILIAATVVGPACAQSGAPIKVGTLAIVAADQEFSRNAADGARGERAWVQTESDLRRDGRLAVDGHQDTAWTVAQRFHQLRVLAAGAENAIPRRRRSHGVDPLGYYMPPCAYAQLQVLQRAVEATKTLDDAKLGDYIRAHPFRTVVGEVRFGAEGEWAHSPKFNIRT